MKKKAKQFAENAHRGQVRKARNIPYVTHPIRVAERLEASGASEALISAAYLHDVVEDTPVEIEEIEQAFGKQVADLVRTHTEDKTKSWKERKQHTIDTIRQGDFAVKQLIIADRLDNLLSLEEDLKEMGSAIWDIFNARYEDQKWYNEGLLTHMDDNLTQERPEFFNEFEQTVRRIFN